MAGEASQMITAQSLTSPQTIIYAVIALSLIPIFIVYPFIQKFFRKGVTIRSGKRIRFRERVGGTMFKKNIIRGSCNISSYRMWRRKRGESNRTS